MAALPEPTQETALLNGTADVLDPPLSTCLAQKGIDGSAAAEIYFRIDGNFVDNFLYFRCCADERDSDQHKDKEAERGTEMRNSKPAKPTLPEGNTLNENNDEKQSSNLTSSRTQRAPKHFSGKSFARPFTVSYELEGLVSP